MQTGLLATRRIKSRNTRSFRVRLDRNRRFSPRRGPACHDSVLRRGRHR